MSNANLGVSVYMRDIYADTCKLYKRTRTPRQITEGVYEGQIDHYYGLGEPIPPHLKSKYNYERGFIAENENGGVDVFACKKGRYYFFELPYEEVFMGEYDDYSIAEHPPRSEDGVDVIPWLHLSFIENGGSPEIVAIAEDPEMRNYLILLWDWIHEMDRNAGGPHDWLDSGTYEFTVKDAAGIIQDEEMEELFSDVSDDATAKELQSRRRALRQRYGARASKDRKSKGKFVPLFRR